MGEAKGPTGIRKIGEAQHEQSHTQVDVLLQVRGNHLGCTHWRNASLRKGVRSRNAERTLICGIDCHSGDIPAQTDFGGVGISFRPE